MNRAILLRHEAELDLADAVIYYEQRQSGFGLRFVSAFERTLERIVRYPSAYAVQAFDIRRAPVRSFPFGVYYRVEAERIVVIGVFHARRNPAAWERRAK
jgi:plasmid stabilization system protein ParE